MPTIQLVHTPSASSRQQLFAFAKDAAPAQITPQIIELYGVESKKHAVTRVPLGDTAATIIGTGKGLLTLADWRDFGGTASRCKFSAGVVTLDASEATAEQLVALAEGLLLGGYKYSEFKEAKDVEVVIELVAPKFEDSVLARAHSVANRIGQARDLINAPANALWPAEFATRAEDWARSAGLVAETWDEPRLEAEKCGGILAVGKGSARGPRMVKVSYGTEGPHIALVGKGITFDTGGLSLKPAESMVGMKYDMAGAASVLAAVLLIADLKLAVRVDAYMCLAENMPSGTATRPGDVIRIRNGKTVEVLNTDAEGRLVLADGLTLASETNPDHIIDVATLTGAATIALGNRYAGLMGHGAAITGLQAAAEAAGELLWHMPLPEELRSLLDSDIADIANVKIGNRAGGMLIAAEFLAEFVGTAEQGTSWAHLDIAGPANNAGAAFGHTPSGASGAMIRTLTQFAAQVSSVAR